MFQLGAIGFATPALLAALVALPVLWWLLRAVPPAPVIRRFPGVALLLGLKDEDQQTDKTPWWLLLLRALAVAALILGFAGPVLNPQPERAGDGPLLIVTDASWASARDWPNRVERMEELLTEAGRAGRAVAVVALTDLPEGDLPLRSADHWAGRLAGIAPQPWAPEAEAVADWTADLPDGIETYWLSDGLARDGRDALLAELEARGPVTVFESDSPILALAAPQLVEGSLRLNALRAPAGDAAEAEITAIGRDPAGVERDLARGTAEFASGESVAELELVLQPELRNRITRFQITGSRSAGAVAVTDDALQRRKVALLTGRAGDEGLSLVSPFFYLRQALGPLAELTESPSIDDLLLTAPDVLILADVAALGEVESAMVQDWVADGGLLLRFAGPRLATSEVSREEEDPLMPVRLRLGGRTVGGAMSWGEPRALRDFAPGSPFEGLRIPSDVTVSSQVLAQPDPALADRTIASLADGTPLVTRKFLGDGQVVLVHTTANADWSTLPLSGLFVEMLERLAVSTRPAQPGAEELAGTVWTPERLMDGFGELREAGDRAGVPGEALAERAPGPKTPPGVYAGPGGSLALNLFDDADTDMTPATWPARIPVERGGVIGETRLAGAFLSAGLALLLADVLAALWLAGRLFSSGGAAARGAAAGVLALALLALPAPGLADEDEADDRLALLASNNVVLAHVLTGDRRVDDVARAGLRGLSQALYRRTSIEPDDPIGVDVERDELVFFPFLYWPITEDTPIPSDAALARLNRYLRGGGMIMFDTRDAELAGLTRTTPAARRLQAIARSLDIPPLEPVPSDHILMRTFYLIDELPGRFTGRDVWVEAAPPDAEQAEGMPFRNLNDGVTPVIIGEHDWASAWAVDAQGVPMLPVGRGMAGERQREIALRFGVNLITHVLTGNYKSDQVHVPALLERLGQ